MQGLLRGRMALVLLGVLVLLSVPGSAEETKAKKKEHHQKPDATVKLTGKSAGVGIGYSWGSGVLTYQGKEYPFSVSGLSAGSIGVSSASASGDVYGLTKLEDFNGTYTSTSAGAAVGGGGGAATMRNQNGVSIHLVGTSRGLKLHAAVDGVKIALTQ